MKMAEGGDDYEALLSKMDKLQSAIDAIEGWELDRQLERAMQALRCPPGKLASAFGGMLETQLPRNKAITVLFMCHWSEAIEAVIGSWGHLPLLSSRMSDEPHLTPHPGP